MPSTTASVRILKTMPFKAGTRTWSNRHHFTGGVPGSSTAWGTLTDAITAVEKSVLLSTHHIVEAIGYAPGSDVPVFTKTYSIGGTHTAGGIVAPGECAALMRFATNSRTSKNHPLYLFNYFHGCDISTSASQEDYLWGTYLTALNTYAADWVTGFSDGSVTHVRAGPQGAIATGSLVGEFVTHRDFPYTPSK